MYLNSLPEGRKMKAEMIPHACLLFFAVLFLPFVVCAQITTTGRLVGIVTDSQGGLVPKAEIIARQDQTGQELKATTNSEGEWTIPSVPNGTYTVFISASNFKKTVVRDIKLDAGQPTRINIKLEPGDIREQVEVRSSELLQAESANVSTTIVGRQIDELPFTTRDALQQVLMIPGVQTPGTIRTSSINGLPKGSVNITLDGANIQDNFLRSGDGFFTQVQPKSDAVQEVTVSTATPGAESAGDGAVQIRFVTANGTSEFHGSSFWQYRSPKLNANYYFNNVDGLPRDRLFLKQYGGKLGGPLLIPGLLKSRNKAFFFFNYEEFHLPQTYPSLSVTGNELVLTSDARNGIFTYKDSTSSIRRVDLYGIAAAGGFPSTPDPTIAQGLSLIDQAVRHSGALRSRIATANDFNRQDYQFQDPAKNIRRFPTARFDWNITKNQHLEFIHNYQFYFSEPDAVNAQLDVYSGSGVVVGKPGVTGSVHRDSFSFVMAHRWAINNRLVNELRVTSSGNGTMVFTREFNAGLFDFWKGFAVNTSNFLGAANGAFYNRSFQSRRNTPTKSINENLAFTHGRHAFNFGFSFLRVNAFNQFVGTQAVPRINLGIASGDPINFGSTSIFTPVNFPDSNSTQRSQAATLYAILTGRVSSINRSASLDEKTRKYEFVPFTERNHQHVSAFYVQDSWKIKAHLTFSYGLRWELEPSPINDNLVYTRTGYSGLFSISGENNLFRPGIFEGNPTQFRLLDKGEKGYRTRKHDFAPSFGFAWSPNWRKGILKPLLGRNGETVIRGGYSVAYTREGFNAFTAMFGSNEGPTLTLDDSPAVTPFIFPAGSVLFRNSTFPALALPPDVSRLPLTPGAGTGGGGSNDFDAKMKAGYAQSYSFGIQRQLGKSMAVEVRFVRSRGTHLWRQYNLNEVNIFENGFLDVFKAAARNLSIYTAANPGCTAAGNCNYGNSGLPGQVNVPLITTAINSSVDLNTTTLLQQGQAGALANGIAFNLGRMNRLIAAGLIPFTTLPDGSKASNFFIVNPQTTGGAFLMTNGIDTSFNALQIELRRRLSKGLLVQGSYQFGKALSNAFVSSSVVFSQPRTLRDLNQDRTSSPWDIRHSFKLDYIYELPIGPGKRFFKGHNLFVSRILGEWQLGGVVRIQSGTPVLITSGGRATFNQIDAGVILHNMTQGQLHDMVKIRKANVCDANGCRGVVYYLPATLIQNTLAAFDLGGKLDPNAPYIGPPTDPGKLGQRIVLFGPWQSRFDFNIIKRIPLTEKVKFEARVQFLNAFNRANFFISDPDNTVGSASANSTSFGQTRSAYRDITVSGANDPGGRLIEFQLRLKF
jgi:hypothetical protein